MPRFLLLVAVALLACKSPEKTPAAVLTQANGPVERGPGGGAFQPAAFGSKLYLGDLVRTGAGTAQLALSDGAKVTLDPNTTIVLRARSGNVQLDVRAGVALLEGRGTYALEMGQVKLADGTVRISATSGKPSLVLVLGQGTLLEESGQQRTLELGKGMLLELGKVTAAPPIDAGLADAPLADAPPPDALPSDAAVVPDGMQIEITGDDAKLQVDGSKQWTKLVAGAASVPARSRVALGPTTTAKLITAGAILTLAGGSRAAIGESLTITLERGSSMASVAAGKTATLAVPGGSVTSTATPDAGAETRIDVDPRGDARVTALASSATLTGNRAAATPLELATGASGIVRKTGAVQAGDTVIPTYFDHELVVGAAPSVTLHDPAGATAVRFAFAGKCPTTGAIELDRDQKFRGATSQITVGKDAASLLVRAGVWAYRLRCGGTGTAVANGRIVVVRDKGTRPLPTDPPRYPIDADGRTYRVSYQSQIPDVQIRAKGGTGPFELHLATGGDDRVLTSPTPTFAIAGTSLKEREYTFYIVQNGQKSKVSTLRIDFDQTAAQVYIEAPVDGKPWGPQVEVRGATLPGWTAIVAGIEAPSDKSTRRFQASIAPPTEARAIAIQLSHPQRGVHVYLRRGAPAR